MKEAQQIMGIHDLYIVDRTELRSYNAPGKIVTPGAALYATRWDNYHITDKARETIMTSPHLQRWFKDMLRRVDAS